MEKKKTCENKEKCMTCTPNCMFFPDMSCQNWEYDKEIENVKRRSDNKKFVCGYDGHIIKSWYDECPKKKDGLKI